MTWSNSSSGTSHIECHLDRVLVNNSFICLDADYRGCTLNSGLSDHSLIFIESVKHGRIRPPFRYFNAWAREEGFFGIIQNAWNVLVTGTPMYRVVQKLARVKVALIKWQQSRPSSSSRIDGARRKLEAIQNQLNGSHVTYLVAAEQEVKHFLHKCLDYKESILKKKSRDKHVNLGGL